MFSFLFAKKSRKEKTEVLKSIIQNISVNEYNKDLYLTSLGILSEKEFNSFYDEITKKLESPEKTILTGSLEPLHLPGINSI